MHKTKQIIIKDASCNDPLLLDCLIVLFIKLFMIITSTITKLFVMKMPNCLIKKKYY